VNSCTFNGDVIPVLAPALRLSVKKQYFYNTVFISWSSFPAETLIFVSVYFLLSMKLITGSVVLENRRPPVMFLLLVKKKLLKEILTVIG